MKLLIINTYYPPDIVGGTEISVSKLAESFTNNHKVSVICIGKKYSHEMVNNVEVYRLRHNKRKYLGVYYEFWNKDILNDFKNLIEKIQPDIIHTNNLYLLSLGIWRIASRFNIPIIHTIRDNYLIGSKYKIKNYFFKYFTRDVNVVTAPSNYTINLFKNHEYFKNASESIVINNSIKVNHDLFQQIKREKLNRKKDLPKLKLAFIGRLSREKGVEYLIEFFIRNFSGSENTLSIFGSGELEESLDSRIAGFNNISKFGFLSEVQLYDHLREIDVLIVPSTVPESFGRVVLDAYQCAVPVIANNIGALPEIIKHMETGIIVEPENDIQLLDAINTFNNTKILNSYISNIERHIIKFDLDIQKSLFEEQYFKMIQRKGE